MSDAPTQRFDAPPPPQPGPPAPMPGGRPNRALVIVLIVVAALLVAAIVVAVVLFLLPHGAPVAASTTSPTPTVSTANPSASASASPSAAASQPAASNGNGSSNNGGSGSGGGRGGSQPTGGAFTSVSAQSVSCYKSDAPKFTPPPIPIQVSWSTVRSQSVWIVAGTSDAADSKYMKLPVSGDQNDFAFEIDYPCYGASTTYTLTLVGDDGKHVSKQFVIKNTGHVE